MCFLSCVVRVVNRQANKFLSNRSDLLILKTIKQSVEMRNSVCHSATICANAIMHAGTTVDTFLRENLVLFTGLFFYLKASYCGILERQILLLR